MEAIIRGEEDMTYGQPKHYYIRSVEGLYDYYQAYSRYYKLHKHELSDDIIDHMLKFSDLFNNGIMEKMIKSGKPVAVPHLTEPDNMKVIVSVKDFEAGIKECEPENIKNGKQFFGGWNELGQRLPPDPNGIQFNS